MWLRISAGVTKKNSVALEGETGLLNEGSGEFEGARDLARVSMFSVDGAVMVPLCEAMLSLIDPALLARWRYALSFGTTVSPEVWNCTG